MAERRKAAGDVAFLLEPDLKESHGGLRDVSVLRAISVYAPLLADYADLSSLDGATALLTDVRVELHRWPGASTTSSCSRTRTRSPRRWSSPMPTP